MGREHGEASGVRTAQLRLDAAGDDGRPVDGVTVARGTGFGDLDRCVLDEVRRWVLPGASGALVLVTWRLEAR